jgi:hypothetical protein
MPRNARCYDVLIASPSDVQAERQIVAECIEDWNSQHSRATGVIIQPRRWEFDAMPETGARPQSFINQQIVDSSDMLIGVFWSRLGSPSGVAAHSHDGRILRRARDVGLFTYVSVASTLRRSPDPGTIAVIP